MTILAGATGLASAGYGASTGTHFWTLDRVHDALGRGPRGAAELTGVSTDTRQVKRGELFVALAGEKYDAHSYLAEAVERGAAAVVVSRVDAAARLGVPVYEVPDTLVGLGALAAYRRRLWGRPVIAVAGSNGKTSTKELLRAALGARLTVHASAGNFNNRVGVPLTLLALPDDADVAVVEVGTNTPGEIAILRDIVRPDAAVLTSIGEEHLEGLGDLAGVLAEEAAIFDGVPVAITPAAQPEVAAAARARGVATVTDVGLDVGDVRPDAWAIGPDGLGTMTFGAVEVRPPVRGLHNLRNAMLAVAAARACGLSDDDIARGIGAMPVPSMRSAWAPLGRATLVNDAYNANPASARAAVDLVHGAGAHRQRVIVLGTMRELGDHAARMHEETARYALASDADLVAGVGDFAEPLARLGGDRVVTAPDVDELWAALEPRLAPDALVLLKASRGMRLERLVPHLERWAGVTTSAAPAAPPSH